MLDERTEAKLNDWFSYHAPTPAQNAQYKAIREAAKDFARVILENTRESADQSVALRKIREAVFVANAAVALEGRY